MEYYDGEYTGEQIDEAVGSVYSGRVVLNNTSNTVSNGEAKPASSSAVYNAIEDVKSTLNGKMQQMHGSIEELGNGKVDKVEGKGLSTNDFDNEAKTLVGKVEGKQDKLVVSTLGNGNIKIEGLGEFMAATPSGDPNHALYVAVGAKWNATTGYWEFNGINDMTNADMAKSLALANMISNPVIEIGQYALMSFRTNVWNKNLRSSVEVQFSEAFRGNSLLEVLDFRTNYIGFKVIVKNITYGFYGCPKLRNILGELDVSAIPYIIHTFYSPLLEEVYLFRVKGNVDVSYSSVFKKECLLFMIQNAAPTTAMTIKVNADVWAWASTDAEVQAALAAQPLVTLISA